ncbi:MULTISPECIES: hypothetical protein [Thermomonosporaceae]|uniref:hypothetical protein n=1 Tax=Thermomonosporaceae TaxID=2012 RepID=UPI00255AB5C7|nr:MULTISPECIES: hypothetical protein [Thermomonosporaceae]MDL4771154.1 hypothetical protein [Actinomadura xylanilytica]
MNEDRRVAVSSVRTHRARSVASGTVPPPGDGWSIADDLDEQTELGALFARALVRAQLRAAAATVAIVAGVVAGLPLLLDVTPALCRARLHGVPVSWLVLALGIQPVWVLTGARHVRRAERIERDFVRLVGRP